MGEIVMHEGEDDKLRQLLNSMGIFVGEEDLLTLHYRGGKVDKVEIKKSSRVVFKRKT